MHGLRRAGGGWDGLGGDRDYGDVWLMERIAEDAGLRRDLETVFGGDGALVDDVLTLAMLPYLSLQDYDKAAEWQARAKTPSARELTPDVVAGIARAITEERRREFFGLRAARLGGEELCAVETVSGPAPGDHNPEIRAFMNGENPPERTMESVVYSISSRLPVYYRRFPGEMTDYGRLDAMFNDLDQAGFKDLVFVTERFYDSLRDLEFYTSRGLKLITSVKRTNTDIDNILKEISSIVECSGIMEYDPVTELSFKQYPKDGESRGGEAKPSNCMTLNLFYDRHMRQDELHSINADITAQREWLDKLLAGKKPISNKQELKYFTYFKVITDTNTNVIKSFEQNLSKIKKIARSIGFFAVRTYGVDFDAMKTYHIYNLRDFQEDIFRSMKEQVISDRKLGMSKAEKEGRFFISFICFIIISYLNGKWQTTNLKELYSSPYDIILEMREIRCIKQSNKTEIITAFNKKQVEICRAFGFEIPESPAPAAAPPQKPARRRGRPPK